MLYHVYSTEWIYIEQEETLNKHTAFNTFGREPRCRGVPSHLIERLRNGWTLSTSMPVWGSNHLGIFFHEWSKADDWNGSLIFWKHHHHQPEQPPTTPKASTGRASFDFGPCPCEFWAPFNASERKYVFALKVCYFSFFYLQEYIVLRYIYASVHTCIIRYHMYTHSISVHVEDYWCTTIIENRKIFFGVWILHA